MNQTQQTDGSAEGAARVSVGVPVYNGERFLEEALNALRAQTFDDFEVIISDNASTDRTETICRDFTAMDRRFKYFRNDVNRGISFNWNRTFHLSSSPLFKWAAHDDVCGVKFLEACVEEMDKDASVALSFPGGVPIDENGEVFGEPIIQHDVSSADPVERFSVLMRDPFWATPLFGVIRRKILVTTRLLGDYIANDHVLLTEIALRGRFVQADEIAFFHRHYPERELHQKSPRDRARYTYSKQEGIRWPRVKLVGGYLEAIQESNLTTRERLRCRAAVGGWLLSRMKARVVGAQRL